MIEVARIERALARRGRRFERRVFTAREIRECRRCARPAAHFAVRFAVKEAVMKAIGTGWGAGVSWRDIEAVGTQGAPAGLRLELHGAAAEHAARLGSGQPHLCVARSRRHALALVLLEEAP